MKTRLFAIDIIKIIFALLIFMRHSLSMGGCTYYGFDEIITNLTGDVMTGFFIVSGFSLYYVYSEKEINDYTSIINFYKKRALTILPTYYLVHIIHTVFLERNIGMNVKLLPVELLGLQSFFDSLFGYLHNGTTWFVSCIIVCYLLYPLLQMLVTKMPTKKRIVLLLVLAFMSIYGNYIAAWTGGIGTYSNPVFRFMEFAIGAIICSFRSKCKNSTAMIAVLISGASIIILNGYDGLVVRILTLYAICTLIYSLSMLRNITMENSKFLLYLSAITYEFFVLQDFMWSKNEYVNNFILSLNNNYLRICVSFGILLCASILVHELFAKQIQKLKNRFRVNF
ncbi:acyltransferase [Faecalicatena contorta]|uniref:acyltransferase family protein n=1 Tax=Faecalicatena contorta TaxID=39482 RepID=UPI001F24F3E0|nr:acyltransferase [Faecalicatena contorta]MCF2680723.1 acyltransferase [Faecalicatena contorta]